MEKGGELLMLKLNSLGRDRPAFIEFVKTMREQYLININRKEY